MEENKRVIVLKRKIEKDIRAFFASDDKKCLLVDGCRQVGKSFLIEHLGKEAFEHFVKVDFMDDERAREIFTTSRNSEDILSRLPLLTKEKVEKGKTLFFFDEIQCCKECVTAMKYLVLDGSYKYILSGSLLGVELYNIKSIPVGYMDSIRMFPMDFEEFCVANGVQQKIFDSIGESFEKRIPVDESIHKFMLDIFRLYLVVGGMPAAVVKYLMTNNLRDTVTEQSNILLRYGEDISQYEAMDRKLRIREVFENIPGELNSINKRYVLRDLDKNAKANRYENTFQWLEKAGVAIPVFNAREPLLPLALSETATLFKLFLCDVGLLANMYMDDIQLRILKGEEEINFGAVYENYVAQELIAHGFNKLFYFNSRKQGEVDFLISYRSKVVPIEVKSGRDYRKHNALDKILDNPKYGLDEAIVLSNANVEVCGRIVYLPVYMTAFIQKFQIPEDMTYRLDFSLLENRG